MKLQYGVRHQSACRSEQQTGLSRLAQAGFCCADSFAEKIVLSAVYRVLFIALFADIVAGEFDNGNDDRIDQRFKCQLCEVEDI